ncbi:MAG: hypothetical protein PHZ07_02210 [Patescibacteria group bacterium]|nr:hypothetical protein [Patescibacteria group bacterium]MDD4304519.1 hypothetical protein [Patescibacteria group bacterium]MDD4694879.1 hypothetical protein [Patescibacteria group bacterium]
MKKLNRKKIILFIVSIFIIIFLIYICFRVFDLKIDDTYFVEKKIRKDFEVASKYLVTGDCESFNDYLYNKSIDFCYRFKSTEGSSASEVINLKSFKLKDLTYKSENKIAFLNIDVVLSGLQESHSITMNGQMIKDGSIWKISKLEY